MSFETDLNEAKNSGKLFGIETHAVTKERKIIYYDSEQIAAHNEKKIKEKSELDREELKILRQAALMAEEEKLLAAGTTPEATAYQQKLKRKS